MELTADVVVVGAGPAGAATALMLAPFHRTVLLDRVEPNTAASQAPRIGESLPAAARRLFRDMGLWESFQHQGHSPRYATRSFWGGPEPASADSIRDPDGPGWHLDRANFDTWLRQHAIARGAPIVAPAHVTHLAYIRNGWQLTANRDGQKLVITTRFVVDAGGRVAPLVRLLGGRPQPRDRLVCSWIHGFARGDAGTTVTIADKMGWWYTAPLPIGRRVLAFHTDADLPIAKRLVGSPALLKHAQDQPDLAALLAELDFRPDSPGGYCAAHSSWIDAASGPGWLAVGDAALACDPLSSQGLLNALYSGLMAADALRRALAGDTDALTNYQRIIARVVEAYRDHLAAWYSLEPRWPTQPFWARRHGPDSFGVPANTKRSASARFPPPARSCRVSGDA
jgi:flavin-dependent dehydrogenase